MAVRVTIDPDLCIGSGDCTRVSATAFALDEAQGVAVPLPGAPTEDPALLVRAAVGCPTQAITVIAEDGTVLHRGNA
jgi:ferredoxin